MKKPASSIIRTVHLSAIERLAREIDQAGDEAERHGAVSKEEMARRLADLDEAWGLSVSETDKPRNA